MEQLESRNFVIEHFESTESFLFEGIFHHNCIYFIFCCSVNISNDDLIKMIRMRDKVSLIYSITSNEPQVDLHSALVAGADFSLRAPLHVERCLVEMRNHFNKIDHLTKSTLRGGVELIPEASTVIRNGNVRKLTALEFRIFTCLFEDPEKIFTREEITSFLSMDTTLRTVDVHISSLRRKINSLNFYIETRRGQGYQLSLE